MRTRVKSESKRISSHLVVRFDENEILCSRKSENCNLKNWKLECRKLLENVNDTECVRCCNEMYLLHFVTYAHGACYRLGYSTLRMEYECECVCVHERNQNRGNMEGESPVRIPPYRDKMYTHFVMALFRTKNNITHE